MRHKRNLKTILLCGVAIMLCRIVLALTICRKCGHEVPDGSEQCVNCGEPVARRQIVPQAEPVKQKATPPAVETLAEVFLKELYAKAQACQADKPGLAYAYYQNVFAVLRLIEADELSRNVGEAVMRNMGLCRKALCVGKVPCRICKGTGKYKVDVGKVSGTKNLKFVDGVQCKHCSGLGYNMAHLTVERIKMNVLQGRQAFEQHMMVENYRRLGRAFIPEELFNALSLRQRVMVMTGIAAPCRSCQYTGLESCAECRGTGWEKCPAENCKDGIVEDSKQRSGGSTIKQKRLNSDLQNVCGMCQGWGEIPCRACQGSTCTICKKCGGTGEGVRCTKCQGAGLNNCNRCAGTGEYKGAKCDKCAGEGVLICTSCKGEGTVSR